MIAGRLCAILLPTILLISPAWANDLFIPVGSLPLWTGTPVGKTIRSRSVDIDLAQLHDIHTAFADLSATPPLTIDPPPPWATLTLNLFDDVVVTGVVEKMEETTTSTLSGTGYWLTGRIVDDELGSLVLLVRGESVSGTVSLSDGVYYDIRTVGDGVYVISEVEEPPIECGVGDLAEEETVVRELKELGEFSQAFDESDDFFDPVPINPEPHSTIDIAFFYTPQARELWAGGTQQVMEDGLRASLKGVNEMFQESGVHLTFFPAVIQEVNYREIDILTDLNNFKGRNDGKMDEVHTIRRQHGADLIVLIHARAGGRADLGYYLTRGNREDSRNNTAAISAPYADTIAHEVGHLMGLRHDRYEYGCENSSSYCRPNEHFFPYAHGYINRNAFRAGISDSAKWGTIMSYPNLCIDNNIACTILPRFSNPRQNWLGDPLGVPATSSEMGRNGPADAVKALNNVRTLVADNYPTKRPKNTKGMLENPAPDSPQSGASLVSGWVCDARSVEVVFDYADGTTVRLPAAMGTIRSDTVDVCGHDKTGFGLVWNWNKMGDGTHTVRVYADNRLLGENTVTVTTLGQEFARGLSKSHTVQNFPRSGDSTLLEWSQARQNFVITKPTRIRGTPSNPGSVRNSRQGLLENPSPGSAHSGGALVSGWHCEAKSVRIELIKNNGQKISELAGARTERTDTSKVCGDSNNGYGLLWNWNKMGDGWHEVRVFADDEATPFATSKVFVTTLGEEFARGLSGEYEISNFPSAGKSVMVEWRQEQQNFVITGLE